MANADVVHHPEAQCFELQVNSLRCELNYRLQGDVMSLTHTGVPASLQGQGLAAELVKAALAHARSQHWTVRPVCSYVQVYMRRHPQTQDLLAPRS
jgi:hypothetical protein